MQIPIGSEARFIGIVDLLTEQAVYYEDEMGRDPIVRAVPEDLKAEVSDARAFLVERICELDDDLTVKFLEGEDISVDELKAGLRKAVIANRATAVFCGSSLRNKGVQPLLDAVVDYLPSPADIPPVKGTNPNTGEETSRPADDDAPLSALVFKIVTDPYVGRLAYFRVYSGKIQTNQMTLNVVKGRRERIGRLLRMYADRREDVTEILRRNRRSARVEGKFHRRYIMRSAASNLVGKHLLPRTGHFGGD